MPLYQTVGIVIGRVNIGEADRIIRFLTPELGKISAVARGVRRIKSRTAGHLELFGETSLSIAKGKSLDVITSARLLWYPHSLSSHYPSLGLAFAFTSIADKFSQEGQPQPGIYEHLLEGLQAIEKGSADNLLELWYKLRFLTIIGLRPELMHCVKCAESALTVAYYFDTAQGGIVCQNCTGALPVPISINEIKLWRLLSECPFDTISHVSNALEIAIKSLPMCDEFYEYHTGQTFRAELYS